MGALNDWYRRSSIDIADAKARQDHAAWMALGASARAHDLEETISDSGGTNALVGAGGEDHLQARPAVAASIDPSKTEVFQRGPDGKLHPIPGWRTTGPFDFGVWGHNINWGGVAQDLMAIGAWSIGRAGLPGLISKRGVAGPVGEGLTSADKLSFGAGVYASGDATIRAIEPRKKPKHW